MKIIEEMKDYKDWWDFPPGVFVCWLSLQFSLNDDKSSVFWHQANRPDTITCRVFRTMDGELHLLPDLIIYGPCIDPHGSFELKLVLYTANPWDNKDALEDLLRHSDHALCFMYKYQ
jgi:hypothetical protein